MSKWIVLAVLALAGLVGSAAAFAPREGDTDGEGNDDRVEIRAAKNPRKASGRQFPNPSNTGVPPGWKPTRTRTKDLNVTKPGAVVEDVLLKNADLNVDAPNVTIRRVKLQGGQINTGASCSGGTVIADSTLTPPPGQSVTEESEGAVSYGGYTARRVEIRNRGEGFRVSGKSNGCGPVRIKDSFVKIATPPGCSHADGIQGFDGNAVKVVNTTVDFRGVCGTAPFFYPDEQGNTRATVDRLLVMGGGFPFRLGMPASVRGLKVVKGSWGFGPLDVKCSRFSHWGAQIVKITSKYKVKRNVRRLRCG